MRKTSVSVCLVCVSPLYPSYISSLVPYRERLLCLTNFHPLLANPSFFLKCKTVTKSSVVSPSLNCRVQALFSHSYSYIASQMLSPSLLLHVYTRIFLKHFCKHFGFFPWGGVDGWIDGCLVS